MYISGKWVIAVSGWGKKGMEALEEFTEIRWVTLQRTKRHFPF